MSAEGGDGEGVVALGEANAVPVGEERGVMVGGERGAEGFEDEELAEGGTDEVGAADYFGNTKFGVVDGARELVAGEAVLSPDEEVAEIAAGGGALRAVVSVGERDLAAVGHAEAPVGREAGGVERRKRRVGGRTPGGGIERLVVVGRGGAGVFVRGGEGAGEILARAMAGKDQTRGVEANEGGAVAIEAG